MPVRNLYISTGSNVGWRAANLRKAAAMCVQHFGPVVKASAIYETAPWGIAAQKSFYNQVLLFHTSIKSEGIMEILLEIEKNMGRVREVKWGPRKIDLDILFIDQLVHNSKNLQVPHPQIQYRRFVLAPLAEIAPNLVHPVLQKTAKTLLDECPDKLEIKMIQST